MTDDPIDLKNLDDNQWEGLCDLVHEQASQLASNAINSGECVEWLVLNGWTTDDIVDRLKEKSP